MQQLPYNTADRLNAHANCWANVLMGLAIAGNGWGESVRKGVQASWFVYKFLNKKMQAFSFRGELSLCRKLHTNPLVLRSWSSIFGPWLLGPWFLIFGCRFLVPSFLFGKAWLPNPPAPHGARGIQDLPSFLSLLSFLLPPSLSLSLFLSLVIGSWSSLFGPWFLDPWVLGLWIILVLGSFVLVWEGLASQPTCRPPPSGRFKVWFRRFLAAIWDTAYSSAPLTNSIAGHAARKRQGRTKSFSPGHLPIQAGTAIRPTSPPR